MRVLAIIPARGGSKGVPRKNIKLLGGKPLIAYSIEAARQSTRIDLSLVSTDDREISEVARSFEIEVLPRPPEFAEDTTPMPDVIRHVLKERGSGFDILVLLQPTCPQRTGEDIDNALKLFEDGQVQSVISVYKVEDHHPARMYKIENNRLEPLFPDLIGGRRQDLPPIYHRNGAIYACRVEHFNRTSSLWDEHPAPFVMPRDRSINIDDPLDFEIAELLFSKTSAK
jgi:CMP-N-acetylneuraminic acid synthetase